MSVSFEFNWSRWAWFAMRTCTAQRHACGANMEQVLILCDVTTKVLVICHIQNSDVQLIITWSQLLLTFAVWQNLTHFPRSHTTGSKVIGQSSLSRILHIACSRSIFIVCSKSRLSSRWFRWGQKTLKDGSKFKSHAVSQTAYARANGNFYAV